MSTSDATGGAVRKVRRGGVGFAVQPYGVFREWPVVAVLFADSAGAHQQQRTESAAQPALSARVV
jgi:hypothetical protein